MARTRARSVLLLPIAALAVLLLAAGAAAEKLEVSVLDGWTTVEGAKVKVKDGKGNVKKEGTTKREGDKLPRVEFDGLDPGTYTVEAEYTDDKGVKKTGKQTITVKKGEKAKVAVNVDEKEGGTSAVPYPTLSQAALGNVSYQGGIEQGDKGLLTRSGYQVSSDGTQTCRHGDGAATPISYDSPKVLGPVYSTGPEPSGPELSGPELTGQEPPGPDDPSASYAVGVILGSTPRREEKPPEKKQPEVPAFYGQVKGKMVCKDGASGDKLANRRIKLVDPALGNPALALNDADKNDHLSAADPLQCTTDKKGACEIHGIPVRDKAKGTVAMDILASEVRSFNGLMIGGRFWEIKHQFGRKLTGSFDIAGSTWVTLSGAPGDAAAIEKGASSAGLKLQENKCRKTKPGPLVENLDSFPIRPAEAVPGARLRLRPEGGR